MPKPVLLIVEDEVLVRTVAVEIAYDAGFSVLQAADADEAIRVLQSRSDIGVVLTDIDMPSAATSFPNHMTSPSWRASGKRSVAS